MSLVTTKDMFEKSMKEYFAIGAFNVNNMEIIQGIVDAAAEENSPVILQASSSAIKYARIGFLKKMIEAALEENDIPIALHLDHGPDFETCKMCIDHGFSSVMIDGSKYDFEQNVALTKKVVEYAHNRGVVVEAELGKLAGIEDEVNVCGDETPSFNEVLDVLSELTGKKVKTIDITSDFYAKELPSRAGEILGGRSIDRFNSNDKIKAVVPLFRHTISLRKGIEMTYNAYQIGRAHV